MLADLSHLLLIVLSLTTGPNTNLEASWSPPTKNTDGSAVSAPLTYNVYQASGAKNVIVATGLVNPVVDLAAGLPPGTMQCFSVTAIQNGGPESPPSPSACIMIPVLTPVPQAPSGFAIARNQR